MTACLTYAWICISGECQQLDIDKGTQLTAIVRGFYFILFGNYLNNRSTSDTGVLGYIGIV